MLLALSVAVALPAAVAAVRMVRWGWVPLGDQAVIAIRATDVLSGHPPELGQLSGLSARAAEPVRSPGPLGYWPFALPARVGPLWGPAVVAAGLSGAAMVATVRLAARRGGIGLAALVAVGLALTVRAINPANLASTWNPAVGVMPLLLLVFLAWSVAAGEVRLLPVAVLVASFCAQVHAALILPAGLVLLVAVATTRTRSAKVLGSSATVAAVCWALPLHDQLLRSGNLGRLLTAPAGERSGAPMVGRVVGDAIGIVPAFLRGDRLPQQHVNEVLLPDPSRLELVTAALAVSALVAVFVRTVRHDRTAAVGPALVVGLVGAAAAVAFATPLEQFLVLSYTAWWIVPVGMLVWAFLAGQVPGIDRAPVLGAAVVAVAALALLSPARAEPEEPFHRPAQALGDAVVAETGSGAYRVDSDGLAPSDLATAVAYRIRRDGGRPIMAGTNGVSAGPGYRPTGARCAGIVTLTEDAVADPLVTVVVRTREGIATEVGAVVTPDEAEPSC